MIKTKMVRLVRKKGIRLLTKLEQKRQCSVVVQHYMTGEWHQDSLLQLQLETAVVIMGKKGRERIKREKDFEQWWKCVPAIYTFRGPFTKLHSQEYRNNNAQVTEKMQSVAQRRHPSTGVGELERLFDNFCSTNKKTAGINVGNLFTLTAFCCPCSSESSGVRIEHGPISPKDKGLIRRYVK